ncbi:MAG TPA: twin-arginine translocase TatA/TatE family subunit [Gemmatimonadaceae bacterium]|nr:twin-arginine translocase TatA/TatE family subunit [Gemmatimonadaceae bacterium]
MIGPLGLTEMLIILLIILLFFGARRIPEIAGSFGKGIREFKKSINEVERSIHDPEPKDRVRPGDETVTRREREKEESPRPDPKRLIG